MQWLSAVDLDYTKHRCMQWLSAVDLDYTKHGVYAMTISSRPRLYKTSGVRNDYQQSTSIIQNIGVCSDYQPSTSIIQNMGCTQWLSAVDLDYTKHRVYAMTISRRPRLYKTSGVRNDYQQSTSIIQNIGCTQWLSAVDLDYTKHRVYAMTISSRPRLYKTLGVCSDYQPSTSIIQNIGCTQWLSAVDRDCTKHRVYAMTISSRPRLYKTWGVCSDYQQSTAIVQNIGCTQWLSAIDLDSNFTAQFSRGAGAPDRCGFAHFIGSESEWSFTNTEYSIGIFIIGFLTQNLGSFFLLCSSLSLGRCFSRHLFLLEPRTLAHVIRNHGRCGRVWWVWYLPDNQSFATIDLSF